MASAEQPQYALWQTNSAVSTHDSWYAASDDEGEDENANAENMPPAASPAAVSRRHKQAACRLLRPSQTRG
jgi:hypothetical protein